MTRTMTDDHGLQSPNTSRTHGLSPVGGDRVRVRVESASNADSPRKLDAHRSVRLTAQLNEALRCVQSDSATGLSASLARINQLVFAMLADVVVEQRQRQASTLHEVRRLRTERDQAGPTASGPSQPPPP